MRQALADIESLLRRYGHDYEANLATIAARTFDGDPQAGCHAVNTTEWWESAHSVAAIDLAVSGGFTVQARQDAQLLRAALIKVFCTLRAYGERNDTGEIIVSQFQKWAESRV